MQRPLPTIPRLLVPYFLVMVAMFAAACLGNEAPAAAQSERGCRDGLVLREEQSLLGLDMAPPALVPGQPIVKRWAVANSGTCAWNTGYRLVFIGGQPAGAAMGSQPLAVDATVAPGAAYTLELPLVAPISPGVYLGTWRMVNERGAPFGERMRASIQTAAAPTPTPAPTQTPAPGIAFGADAERVQQGSAVTLTWDVQGAQAVYFRRAGEAWEGREVAIRDSAADIPGATTTYELRVVRAGGEELRAQTVYVDLNPLLPQVAYFTVAPAGELALGQCVEIAWRVTGDAQEVAIFRNKETIRKDAALESVMEDCPETPGNYEYALGAQGAAGRNYALAHLRVVEIRGEKNADAAAVAAERSRAKPAINQFAVLPQALVIGECVDLRWLVGGEVGNIRVTRDRLVLMAGAPRSGSGSDCPRTIGVHRYQLTAAGPTGRLDIAAVLVEVTASSPTATPAPETANVPSAAVTVPAASIIPPPEAAAPDTPAGKEYVVISYRNAAGEPAPPLTGTRMIARFGDDGVLRGDGGCNAYSTAYRMYGAQLTLEPVGGTERFCTEPLGVMEQETQYLSALGTAAAYTLEGGLLTLLDGASNPVAVLVAAE